MMKTAADSKKTPAGIRWGLLQTVMLFVLLIGVSVLVFTRYYSAYTDGILYAERLNQMQEVTGQLFNGLEDVVENQWYNADIQTNRIMVEKPETTEELLTFMEGQAELSKFGELGMELVAVDDRGRYYTQNGAQGLLGDMELLTEKPERVSFVSTAVTRERTQMFFLVRLAQPIQIRDGNRTTKLIYSGVARDMTELNQYFNCKAYEGKNAVYVLDSQGIKLFSGENGREFLEGYNVYTILRNMQYLHGSTFESALETLEQTGTSYSNAILNGQECYYALYRMENAEWVLLFMVPSSSVAVNTVSLVQSTTTLVMVFAVCMVLLCAGCIYRVLRRQQKQELQAAEKTNAVLEASNKELERAQFATASALKTAEAANRAKTDFLSSMSHDIRTPMNAIVGIASLMENELDDKEKMRDHLTKLKASSQHLLNLINDILDMNKIESGAKTLNITNTNLAELVMQLDSVIRQQAAAKHQSFVIRTLHLRHENLMADSVSVNRVLSNILSNAVKYTPEGGHILFEVEEMPRTGHYARYKFVVQDDGIGMSGEYLKHLYEPFTREESSLTNKVQGTGLGMAITKNLVDQMGGTIHVESVPDKGSRFEIVLDFKLNEDADRATEKLRLLLVHCDDAEYDNIRDAVQGKPVFVQPAWMQMNALDELSRADYDVALVPMDYEDPERKNKVKELRRAASSRIIILGAAQAQRADMADRIAESGVDGYLQLPFFLSNLEAEVRRVRRTDGTRAGTVSPLHGMKFLCAEDNTINAEILQAMLEMSGASCKIYPNGAELVKAFETVKPGDYDMILMDVQMPVMDGLEATRTIRSGQNPLGRTIPILAMTANAFTEDMEKSKEAGMDAHLSKPVDIAMLEQVVRRFIVTPPPINNGDSRYLRE